LLPIDQRAEWAFYPVGDDEDVERLWARERGLSSQASLTDILRAQIEEYRADVFYNLDSPGCVKCIIGWHAIPYQNVSFAGYDLMVCNFPSTLVALQQLAYRTACFSPAYDPELEPYATRRERSVDVLFVGGYSRRNRERAAILDAVANMAGDHNIVFHLDRSRLCRLAESPLGWLLPLAEHQRPRDQGNHKGSDFRPRP
jgi:hypothetical protein